MNKLKDPFCAHSISADTVFLLHVEDIHLVSIASFAIEMRPQIMQHSSNFKHEIP